MCVAIQEMMKDSKAEGILEGRREGVLEGRQQIVRNMLVRNMSDEDIMAITECDKEFIDAVRNK
jgi:predicted transposase YdaD